MTQQEMQSSTKTTYTPDTFVLTYMRLTSNLDFTYYFTSKKNDRPVQ